MKCINAELFRVVNALRPWSPRTMQTDFEKSVRHWSKRLLLAGIFLSAIVPLPFYYWKLAHGPLSVCYRNSVLIVVMLGAFLGVAGILAEALPAIEMLIKADARNTERLYREMLHNEMNMLTLCTFAIGDLRAHDPRVSLVQQRWKPATLLATSGVLFSFLSLIWNVQKEFAQVLGIPPFLIFQFIGVFCTALFIASYEIAKRENLYEYQRGLIAAACQHIERSSGPGPI